MSRKALNVLTDLGFPSLSYTHRKVLTPYVLILNSASHTCHVWKDIKLNVRTRDCFKCVRNDSELFHQKLHDLDEVSLREASPTSRSVKIFRLESGRGCQLRKVSPTVRYNSRATIFPKTQPVPERTAFLSKLSKPRGDRVNVFNFGDGVWVSR